MLMQKSLKNSLIKRGDIYIADFDPSFGQEIHKKRPVLIISNDILNQISPTLIVLPFSSVIPQTISFEKVKLSKIKGLAKESVILVNHIRAIDKSRLIKKIGKLSKSKLEEVEESLKLVLGMIELD